MLMSKLPQGGRIGQRTRALYFPYWRLGRIGQFELDRGLSKNADDGGLLAAFPHPIIVWRVRDPAHEAAGGHRHRRLRLEILAGIHPPGSGDDKAQPVSDVGVRGAHVARVPLDQHDVRPGLIGCAENRHRLD